MPATTDKSPGLETLKTFLFDFSYFMFIVLKVLLVPLDFLFQGFRIYIWSCFVLMWYRCFGYCFKCVNERLCKCMDLRYTDPEFKATAASVNSTNPEGKFFAWVSETLCLVPCVICVRLVSSLFSTSVLCSLFSTSLLLYFFPLLSCSHSSPLLLPSPPFFLS